MFRHSTQLIHRNPFRGTARFSRGCRHQGGCTRREDDRLYSSRHRKPLVLPEDLLVVPMYGIAKVLS
jgi:hypothetical protein